jgi:hypothetical protein
VVSSEIEDRGEVEVANGGSILVPNVSMRSFF